MKLHVGPDGLHAFPTQNDEGPAKPKHMGSVLQLPPTGFAHSRLDSPQSAVGQWMRQTQPAPTVPHGSPVVEHGGYDVEVEEEVVVDVDDVLLVEVVGIVDVLDVDVVLLDVDVLGMQPSAQESCANTPPKFTHKDSSTSGPSTHGMPGASRQHLDSPPYVG